MKKFVRVFVVYALVSLLIAGLCATFVWRSNQQHKNDRAFIVAVSWENTPAALAKRLPQPPFLRPSSTAG